MNGVHVLYIPPTTPYSVRHTHSVPVHEELTSNSSCACSISLSYSRSMQSIWGGAMTVSYSTPTQVGGGSDTVHSVGYSPHTTSMSLQGRRQEQSRHMNLQHYHHRQMSTTSAPTA